MVSQFRHVPTWLTFRNVVTFPKRIWEGFWMLFAMGILAAAFAGDTSIVRFCAVVIYVVVIALAFAVAWIAWWVFGPWVFVLALIALAFWLVYQRGVARGRDW